MSVKNRYPDLIDKTLDAYTVDHIDRYYKTVKEQGLTEHGFPRLTANIGILIAYGRRKELLSRFISMMDLCVEQITSVKAQNEFSVHEMMYCLMALEASGAIDTGRIEQWKNTFRRDIIYNRFVTSPEQREHNWACFTAVSEYMRQYMGLCSRHEFIDLQIQSQLFWLDENGMYKDDPEKPPLVYDLVVRCLFCLLLHFGYNGKYKQALDDCLRKTGLLTLRMQSTTGEVPFGGRSNQFLHNEAHCAVVLEYEANRYYKEGNQKLASMFRYGADLALAKIRSGLETRPIYHIKNRFPTEGRYGCEKYAYFDKYMITAASYLNMAMMICNDSIPSAAFDFSPDIFSLSKDFHKTFLRAGDYFAEIETDADPRYDAGGIGRVHRRGAPSAICLSMPGTKTPNYAVDMEDKTNFSIAAGVFDNGEYVFAASEGVKYTQIRSNTENDSACAHFVCEFPCGKNVYMICTLTGDGLRLEAETEERAAIMLPAFDFDGERHTEIRRDNTRLVICYRGWECQYTSSIPIISTGKFGCNRNGHYRIYRTEGARYVSVNIRIEPSEALG